MRIIQTADLTPATKLTRNDNDWVYNGLDTCVTLEVLQAIKPQLDNTTGTTYSFSKALQGPVLEMSMGGLLVDQRRRSEMLTRYKARMVTLSEQLDDILVNGIGTQTSWRSNQQLIKLFYSTLGLPAIRKRNANGAMAPTVNREALEKLASYFIAEPICARLMLLRELDKKRQVLEGGIDPDGHMRTSLNIAGTNTGRLASSLSEFGTGGNQQNIDRELRSVFIAAPGRKFANLDLEQADSRNVGAICWNIFTEQYGEGFAGSYLDACESGDLHTVVARMVWPDMEWGPDPSLWKAIADDKLNYFYRQFTRRDICKRLGHATNFLGQAKNLAMKLRIVMAVVADFQARYLTGFPCIPAWQMWTKDQLKEHSSLTTLLGRRRQFFGRSTEEKVQREAVAYAPQSMTAEEINRGILNVFRNRDRNVFSRDVRLKLQVHDSLLIEYPEEVENELLPWAIEQLKVGLLLHKGREFYVPVEAKVGWNWGDVDEKNADGMVKWKGHDGRKRSERIKLNVRDLL